MMPHARELLRLRSWLCIKPYSILGIFGKICMVEVLLPHVARVGLLQRSSHSALARVSGCLIYDLDVLRSTVLDNTDYHQISVHPL